MELDREALMQLIDSRVALGIEKWYHTYIIPLHNEDKESAREFRKQFDLKLESLSLKVENLFEAFNKAKGARWALGILAAAIVVIINHYWTK